MEKIFVGKSGEAVFTCPYCGFTKTFDTSAYRDKDSRIVVKCQCGQQVRVLIEFRQHYRKQVNLLGECTLHKTNALFPVRIQDLSLNGLSFYILHNISEDYSPFDLDDLVTIQFRLDNSSQDMIVRKALVKNIRGPNVGVSFIRPGYEKELGFYLMR